MIFLNQRLKTFFHCSKCLFRRSQTRVWNGKKLGARYADFSTSVWCLKYNTAGKWIQPDGYHTGISVYNTLTKRNDEIILPKGKHLSWYVCGPTVYDSAHVGHASCYMRFDIMRRILENFFDINVTYMMGITDVDDKIINRANELEQEFNTLSKHFEYEFFEELALLNIQEPTFTSRVSGSVPEIIRFIERIMDRGHAYRADDGSVNFDVKSYGGYQRFVPEPKDKPKSEGKKDPRDFTLWKAAKPGEPYWESPWGPGRPGWHIECSAMASEIFGTSLDIHSGGQDLIFPHHENEFAQSCSYHDVKQWANYWIHTGHLANAFNEEKMSKSLKNIVLIPELLEKYTPNQFRMLCLVQHYQKDIVFNDDEMLFAKSFDAQISNFLAKSHAYIQDQITGSNVPEAELLERLTKTNEKMVEAFKDNFNTPNAMHHLIELINSASTVFKECDSSDSVQRSPGTIAAISVFVKRICNQLGFQKPGWQMGEGSSARLKDIVDASVKFRWDVREFAMKADIPLPEGLSAKEQKNEKRRMFGDLFEHCDNYRSQMSHYKVFIQDEKTGSIWDFIDKEHIKKPEKPEDQSKTQTKDSTTEQIKKTDNNS